MDDTTPFPGLPYGPRFQANLAPLHRAFLTVNRRVAAPALRAGLGPLFATPVAGSIMLLRTRGRKSGLLREAPLGYVIHDGAIWCIAGFGERTHWYQNLLADPRVECLLPAGAVSGTAERVTEPAEWLPAYRAMTASLGIVGRLTTGDVRRMSDEELERHRASLPLVRIRVTGVAPGAFDPGGLGWLPAFLICTWLTVKAVSFLRRPLRR